MQADKIRTWYMETEAMLPDLIDAQTIATFKIRPNGDPYQNLVSLFMGAPQDYDARDREGDLFRAAFSVDRQVAADYNLYCRMKYDLHNSYMVTTSATGPRGENDVFLVALRRGHYHKIAYHFGRMQWYVVHLTELEKSFATDLGVEHNPWTRHPYPPSQETSCLSGGWATSPSTWTSRR
jgi:hypothetical protein